MKISSLIFGGFISLLIITFFVFYIHYKFSKDVHQNMQFLVNSETVIRTSVSVHKSIIEMQSAFRGFLLTDNPNFLLPYNSGIVHVPEQLKNLRSLVSSTKQKQRIDSILLNHSTWQKYSLALISAKQKTIDKTDTVGEYAHLIETRMQKEVGKKLNDQINVYFNEFDQEEYFLREKRRAVLNDNINKSNISLIVLISVMLVTGIACAFYIQQIISGRIKTLVSFADQVAKGNFETIDDKKSDELSHLSYSLNIMSYNLKRNFEELKKKNLELDQFGYVVSHDLKAPLRGMFNVFRWIEEDVQKDVTPELKRYHEMLKGRILRMENLITGLFEYARIGKEEQLMEMTNTAELVKEIAEMIVPTGFNFEMQGNFPVIKTGRVRLQQVMTNLISNAVKYHNDGSNARITVSCEEDEQYYKFGVHDNGIGIAKEHHEKIFRIFQTLKEKNAQESTGVGLAIVKKIVEEQNGEVKVQSKPGNGASFYFTWKKKN